MDIRLKVYYPAELFSRVPRRECTGQLATANLSKRSRGGPSLCRIQRRSLTCMFDDLPVSSDYSTSNDTFDTSSTPHSVPPWNFHRELANGHWRQLVIKETTTKTIPTGRKTARDWLASGRDPTTRYTVAEDANKCKHRYSWSSWHMYACIGA